MRSSTPEEYLTRDLSSVPDHKYHLAHVLNPELGAGGIDSSPKTGLFCTGGLGTPRVWDGSLYWQSYNAIVGIVVSCGWKT